MDYLNNLVEHDAQVQFVKGFKFRPEEKLFFAFSCNLVSRKELVECTGFLSMNFVCFLGVNEQVDDRGHRVLLRVVIPLRSIERVLPRVCVVPGIYQAGETVDAMLLNTATARHQIVWVDEFPEVEPTLARLWESARSVTRADDALPVSLVLNPEFASLSASSAEGSPRSRLVLRPLMLSGPGQEQPDEEDAVSDEYDSEHAESFLSMHRTTSVSSSKIQADDALVLGEEQEEPLDTAPATDARSNAWSDVKI